MLQNPLVSNHGRVKVSALTIRSMTKPRGSVDSSDAKQWSNIPLNIPCCTMSHNLDLFRLLEEQSLPRKGKGQLPTSSQPDKECSFWDFLLSCHQWGLTSNIDPCQFSDGLLCQWTNQPSQMQRAIWKHSKPSEGQFAFIYMLSNSLSFARTWPAPEYA